ncbi:MAG: hypothetical protein JRI99_08460 [Deltaproteobacteria bacterium]|nr:hypothetical protein [Deltaproteobacteria bacterium]
MIRKALILFVVLLYLDYIFRQLSLPFYMVADQDSAVIIDNLLIHGNLTPDHITAPGFGINLILILSQKAAKLFGILSAISLDDVKNSLNPFIPLKEMTLYSRLHTPLLLLISTLCIAKVTTKIAHLRQTGFWFMVLLLSVLQGFSYQTNLIRTETYAIFFWSVALYLIQAGFEQYRRHTRIAYFVSVGLFLGLSFLTKVQLLFYVLLSLPVFLLFRAKEEKSRKSASELLLKRKEVIFLSIFNIFLYAILFVSSYQYQIDPGKGSWATGYGLTPTAIAFSLFLVLVVLSGAALDKKPLQTIRYEYDFINLCVFGFLLSFFFHFILFDNYHLSWEYLLMDFKILFLRHRFYSVGSATMYENVSFFTSLGEKVLTNILELSFFIMTFSVSLFFAIKNKGVRNKTTIAYILIFVLSISNFLFATRNIFRDLLLIEIPFVTAAFIYWINIDQYLAMRNRKKFIPILLCVILLYSFTKNRQVADKFIFAISTYGSSPLYWVSNRYYDNHLKLREALYEGRFTPEFLAHSSMHLLQRYPHLKTTLRAVFSNRRLDMNQVGFAEKGHPIRTDDLNETIQELPNALRGGILVDLSNSRFKDEYFINHAVYAEHVVAEYRPGDIRPFDSKYISIVPRTDKAVFLFMEGGVSGRIVKKYPSLQNTDMVLKSSKGIFYKGFLVSQYSILARAGISGHCFSVLIHNFNTRPVFPKKKGPDYMEGPQK